MNTEFCVDANVFITAWYSSYPITVFPSLWEKIAEHQQRILLLPSINAEIEPISLEDKKLPLHRKKEKYPLRIWIDDYFYSTKEDSLNIAISLFEFKNNFSTIENLSLKMESKYEINPQSKGASENDIQLITCAKEKRHTVVTLEAEQKQNPKNKANYKIPLICQEEGVRCIDFITMITELEISI